MEKDRASAKDLMELRLQAEEHLRTQEPNMPSLSASHIEMQKINHELAVHQIELEMQQTELLQLREKLELELERFTELYDFAPLGYLMLARDGTILQVNLTGTILLGVERSLLVGDRFNKFVATEDLPDFKTFLERVFSKKGTVSCEVMLQSDDRSHVSDDFHSLLPKKGALHHRTVRIDAVVSDDGQECRAVVTDISMQKLIEKENAELQSSLVQLRKLESISRLAGGLAHEFNNMLQVMMGKIDNLIAGKGVSRNVRERLIGLRLFVLKSAGLPHQLLVFARKQVIVPVVLDCNVAVDEMLNMLRRLIGEDINLTFTPGNNLWPVMIDPSQVDQIMVNLALNSRDAIQGAGTFTIETGNVVLDDTYSQNHPGALPGEYVQLVVRDNGRGIDKETMLSLFEPFFTTKTITENSGLGLATLYGIVKQNNGFVDVSSRDGEGTTFEIYLPRSSDVLGSSAEKEPTEVPEGDETILLVEDNDSVREITEEFLKSFGYHVLTANTLAEALSLSADYSDNIHLLVTDMIKSATSRWHLSKAIIKSRPELKILFISRYNADIFDHHGDQNEHIPFLGKPFSRLDLACKVREVLDMEPFIGI